MPRQPAYLTKNRFGTFYFRAVVPKKIRQVLGMSREIRRSLQTDSPRLAARKARQFLARYEAIFDRVLSMIGDEDSQFTDDEIAFFASELEQAGKSESTCWANSPVTPAPAFRSALTDDAWRDIEDQQRRQVVAQLLAGSIHRPIPEPQRQLAERLCEVGATLPLAKFKRMLPQMLEAIAIQYAAPAPASRATSPAEAPKLDGPTLYKLWEQLWEHNLALGKKKAPKTKVDEHGRATKLNILANNQPVNRLTLKDWNSIYLQLSAIRTSRGFKLPPPESPPESILATEGQRRIDPKTAEKLSVLLGPLHKYAFKQGLTDVHPDKTDKPTFVKSTAGEMPEKKGFTKTELEAFFNGYLYTGTEIGFGRRVFPFQFWLPLVGMFTGGRINELCQLDTGDVKKDAESGVWTISIIDDPEGMPYRKQVKNDPSRRILPIHSELVRIGLLEYVEQARHEGRHKLFSDGLTVGAQRTWGSGATAFFCRMPSPSTPQGGYLHHCGIRERLEDGTTDEKNFHTFRHTFANLIRAAGVDMSLLLPTLMGHAKPGATEKYGWGYSLGMKQQALEAINLPVDLSRVAYGDFVRRFAGSLGESIASHREEYGLNQKEPAI